MNWQNVLRSAINIFSKVNSRQGCHAEYSAQTLCLHAYMMSYSTLAPMFRILNFVIAHSCKTDSTFRDCFRRIGIRPYDWGAGLRLLYCRYAYHFKLSWSLYFFSSVLFLSCFIELASSSLYWSNVCSQKGSYFMKSFHALEMFIFIVFRNFLESKRHFTLQTHSKYVTLSTVTDAIICTRLRGGTWPVIVTVTVVRTRKQDNYE